MAATEGPPPANTYPIPPFTMPLISPSALLQAHVSQNPPTRPSRRAPNETRPISLNIGSLTHCNGSSVVRVGESTIVCGIRAEILPVSDIPHYRADDYASEPNDEQDTHKSYGAVTLNNLLVPNLELSTNAHPSFPVNVAPSVTAQSLSQRVLSLLHTTRLVRVTDLEVRHTGGITSDLDPDDPAYVETEKDVLKAYWVLYIDCVCLSYGGEGNVFDTTVLAVTAALRDMRLPQARWDEDQKRVLCNADMKYARALRLNGLPVPLGFGVFVPDSKLDFGKATANGIEHTGGRPAVQPETVLIDTDVFEDDVCEEKGCVVIDSSSGRPKLLRIEKAGGSGRVGVKELKELISDADKRWKEWQRVLENAVKGNG